MENPPLSFLFLIAYFIRADHMTKYLQPGFDGKLTDSRMILVNHCGFRIG